MVYMNGHKKNIILINSPGLLTSDISSALSECGYHVSEAEGSYDDILAAINKNMPGMVLIDIDKHPLDDISETALSLKNQFHLHSIFITSGYDETIREKTTKSVPYGYLFKPLNIDALRAALDVSFNRLAFGKRMQISKNKYRSIFKSSKDAIFIADCDGIIVDFNESMLSQFDYSEEDIPNITLNDLFANLDEVVTAYKHRERLGFIKDVEVKLKKKTKKEFYGLMSSSFLGALYAGKKLFQYMIKEITPIKERVLLETQENIKKMNELTNEIIHAISMTVEVRDPYTAGHQRNVSELAMKIAREMDFDADRIRGLQIASLMHDLGKLNVPSEILSKPGKLNADEFSLIKNHSKVGFEILKSISFPWPIAKIVLQHHERMDGTGYPDGLRGKDILLEARIIAVADAVDAMSSHRPYRASIGLKAAVEEINEKKGQYYDPAVVDALVRVIANDAENIADSINDDEQNIFEPALSGKMN